MSAKNISDELDTSVEINEIVLTFQGHPEKVEQEWPEGEGPVLVLDEEGGVPLLRFRNESLDSKFLGALRANGFNNLAPEF